FSIFEVKMQFKNLRVVDEINIIRLHRIWICFQGALMGEYLLSLPINATQKTGSKASKVVEFISSTALIVKIFNSKETEA
ncbi:hypothetical protein QUF76_08740, partial [Desulfobacterales bacterium HSG16]|nr:hypothetical protein [Desulfobacterales bacterium HSG16]